MTINAYISIACAIISVVCAVYVHIANSVDDTSIMETAINNWQERYHQLELEYKRLQTEYEKLHIRYDELDFENDTHIVYCQQLEQEKKELKERYTQLKKDYDEVDADRAVYKNLYESLQHRYELLVTGMAANKENE